MKFSKILLFKILFCSTFLSAFNFFPKLKNQADFFWHLKILNLDKRNLLQNQGQGVKVAVLDTEVYEKPEIVQFYQSKFFTLLKFSNFASNLPYNERFFLNDQTLELASYFSMSIKKNDNFSQKALKKNHAACVFSLIRQIAPNVEIFSIPIFNDRGVTNVSKFINGLEQALQKKIDILYIGLKIDNKNISHLEKDKILQLLSQFLYVVAPAGNDGFTVEDTAFPANSIFFSVGAFEKKEDQCFMCDFSQKNNKNSPHFIMPGKNIGCFLFNDDAKNIVPCLISGTSMAAACMVGCLALLLSNGGKKLSQKQFHFIVQKNSNNFFQNKNSGDGPFGFPDILSALFCIEQLEKRKIEMGEKKFMKNFEKELKKILKKPKGE